jgi:hypothetical protein
MLMRVSFVSEFAGEKGQCFVVAAALQVVLELGMHGDWQSFSVTDDAL